uniref:Uncharacterized protein n=1 Tax=Meloidogyne enterolobii TaxID=390850 RepID=A0A6V7UN47_MELEN|nr:unnamed protein product [Meloidogyne enterolobii]
MAMSGNRYFLLHILLKKRMAFFDKKIKFVPKGLFDQCFINCLEKITWNFRNKKEIFLFI